MDANKSNSQFPIPGIALVLVALGIFVYSENPFNSTRPDPPSGIQSTAEDVRARLWQDPFDAVQKHRESFDSKLETVNSISDSARSANDFVYQDEKHIVCTTPGDTFDAKNKAHSYSELGCRIDNDASAELRMLAVMVPGANYAEDNETRIRSRYAVVSALSKAKYIPADAEHIGFMNFTSLCAAEIKDKSTGIDNREGDNEIRGFCNWPAIIPYEWFVYKEIKDKKVIERKTLVLWVDDGVLAKNNPLQMLNSLRSKITEKLRKNNIDEREYSFDVIGPASSTTLIKMYEEAYAISCVSVESVVLVKRKDCNHPLITDFENHDIKIYSSKATMDDVGIKKYIEKNDNADIDWLKIIKTIPGDDELVEAMLNELLRRGINPYKYVENDEDEVDEKCLNILAGDFKGLDTCKDIKGIRFNRNKKQDHVVLIGEWDTAYSRNFNDLFRRNIKNKSGVKNVNWLHSYNYLRGIDGATGSEVSKNNKASKKSDGKEIRRPVGENQYDYLRNIGDQISNLNASLADGGKVRAIGIVGSDTYDKLLVLQALRERFPEVVFFTTDLDSRMLHKSENKWARNLVVASGFGLSPKDENQHEITTFRDSYQTSLYLSVLTAIDYSLPVKCNECERNVSFGLVSDVSDVFDISDLFDVFDVIDVSDISDVFGNVIRARVFEIGNDQAVDYSPDYFYMNKDDFEFSDDFFRYGALLAFFLLLIFYQASHASRVLLSIVVGVVFSVAAVAFISEAQDSIEYKEIFSGTSIWLAILIRMSAAFLALVFILYTLKCMRVNTKEIIEKYDLKKSVKSCPVRFRDMVLIDTWGGEGNRLSTLSVSELMCQYLNLAGCKRWLPRVSVMTFLFMVISYGFMSINGFAYTPFHGEISSSLSGYAIRVCVFLYLFLVFLVVDITRLYARFVKLLSNTHVIWSETVTDKYCRLYGVPKEIAEEKLKLNLIVQRSRIVDVLIFLPFVILSLMIISRSSFFDRWHMSVGLAVVIVLGACFALSSAIRLRRAAESARKNVLAKLEILHKQQVYKEAKCEIVKKDVNIEDDNIEQQLCEYKLASRLHSLIEEIKNIKDGPFSPITHHPIFSAIAMPFGGVGGLYLIDYMTNLGV